MIRADDELGRDVRAHGHGVGRGTDGAPVVAVGMDGTVHRRGPIRKQRLYYC